MPTPDELVMRVFLAYSVKEGDGEPFFSLKKEKSMNPRFRRGAIYLEPTAVCLFPLVHW